MLNQKECSEILKKFWENNMNGYKEWFEENVNCEIILPNETKRAIRLRSTAKNYIVVAVEGWNILCTVPIGNFKML